MKFISNILIKILGKEVKEMMAMLFAIAIVEERKTFKDVPRLLKEKVRIELRAMDR
jgi:hypothetical protein